MLASSSSKARCLCSRRGNGSKLVALRLPRSLDGRTAVSGGSGARRRPTRGASSVAAAAAPSSSSPQTPPASGSGAGPSSSSSSSSSVDRTSTPASTSTVSSSSQAGASAHNSGNGSSSSGNDGAAADATAAGRLAGNPSLLRRSAAARNAAEALDLLLQAGSGTGGDGGEVSSADAELLLAAALERGNADLALSLYAEMCAARRAMAAALGGGDLALAAASASAARRAGSGAAARPAWPAATLATTVALAIGLCRAARLADALAVMRGVRSGGVPRGDDVAFGYLVPSPLPPNRPLAVVQPQEGAKVVADADSRYEFELFSGEVASAASEARPAAGGGLLAAAARAAGVLRTPPAAAVHTWVVRAPDGTARTFRAATATADVPASVGDRVTVVAAPERGRGKARRVLLTTAPPGARPGEPLSVVNHRTGAALRLSRPPPSGGDPGLPGWALPAAVLLAGGDAASALIDPSLPSLLLIGAAAAVGSAVAGNALVLPRLKQLPPNAVKLEAARQALLKQHADLTAKVATVLAEASDDARALARLWQLQAKMEAVGGGASGGGSPGSLASPAASVDSSGGGNTPAARSSSGSPSGGGSSSTSAASAAAAAATAAAAGTYAARIGRVAAARAGVEERLAARLALLDGYATVLDMVEIEVEMDSDVPAAEALEGLGAQIARLAELEALEEEWRAQAEAQDEVERLLRSPSL